MRPSKARPPREWLSFLFEQGDAASASTGKSAEVEYYLKPLSFSMLALLLFSAITAKAEVHLIDETTQVLGRTGYHTTLPGESLIEIARNFGIGYNTVTESNRELNPFVPGTAVDVTINTSHILPDVLPGSGVVINLSDYRLYCFFSSGEDPLVAIFPIGIGDDNWGTPLGSYTVTDKVLRPSWSPPPSIRKEDPSLRRRIPAGPENPLGSHALRLSRRSILIHGTHRPFSVGRKASHGCIHLYPEDIPLLFKMVGKGTKVSIIRQPIKAGTRAGRVFVQVHHDSDFDGDYLMETKRVLEQKGLYAINHERLSAALRARDGIPTDITGE